MSAQVQSIAEWMSVVIKLTAPTIRPDVAYVQASGMSPIQELEPDGMLSMREFQVQSGPIVEMGEFIGPCYELWHEMDVVMRYMRDNRQGDEWREVDRMAASDFDRVLLALTRPPLQSPWSSAGVWNIQFSAHDKLAKSERHKGVWEQRIVFRVLYSVTDLIQEWGWYLTFTTQEALNTYLAASPVGTIAALVDATTRATISLWMTTAYGVEELNVPTVKTISRAASALPQTAQTPYFTVTGKCMVLKAIGEVTTLVQAQANNLKLVSNPTVGADVDMCAVVDANADTLGTIYTITGTLADAMVATPSGAVQAQIAGVDVAAGTIDLSASASSTGATKWTIHYVPINGGTIAAL